MVLSLLLASVRIHHHSPTAGFSRTAAQAVAAAVILAGIRSNSRSSRLHHCEYSSVV